MLSFSNSKNLIDTFNLNTDLEPNWYNSVDYKDPDYFQILQNFYSKIEISSYIPEIKDETKIITASKSLVPIIKKTQVGKSKIKNEWIFTDEELVLNKKQWAKLLKERNVQAINIPVKIKKRRRLLLSRTYARTSRIKVYNNISDIENEIDRLKKENSVLREKNKKYIKLINC